MISEACPICNGTEWIYNTSDETASPCSCQAKARADRRLQFADIPLAYKNAQLGNFNIAHYKHEKDVIKAVCAAVNKFMASKEEFLDNGVGLYLHSATKGSGKTRMAASIANRLMENHTVKFATSSSIVQEIKNSWGKEDREAESKLLNALYTVEILVIDDFGTEKATDWVNGQFYNILNERYIRRLTTFYTSNTSIDKLEYDDRITNRIKERTLSIAFPEESIREYIAKRQNEEFRR